MPRNNHGKAEPLICLLPFTTQTPKSLLFPNRSLIAFVRMVFSLALIRYNRVCIYFMGRKTNLICNDIPL
jgi:hypothetical protein